MHGLWNPWHELRRRDHIIFELDPIAKLGGGALYARRGALAAIVIDPDLSRRDRRAALAHELVHDERGGIVDHYDAPATWAAIVIREERTVQRITADRLVPTDLLADWARTRASVGPVFAFDVAEAFDVPDDIAAQAVALLATRTA